MLLRGPFSRFARRELSTRHPFKVTPVEEQLIIESPTESMKDLCAYFSELTMKVGVEDAAMARLFVVDPDGIITKKHIITMKVNADNQAKLARSLGKDISEELDTADKKNALKNS